MSYYLDHFSHEHKLVPFGIWYKDGFNCNMCNRSDVSDESGYGCFDCRYFLNKTCAELPRYINDHPLHPQHRLALVKINVSASCYYCDKPFPNEYIYACDNQCSFYMHSRCASIPLPTITYDDDITAAAAENNGGGRSVVQYVCHKHPMTLSNRPNGVQCFGCHSQWLSGPAYTCSSSGEECDIILHKSCAELPQKIDRHPFHSLHPLTLQVSKPRLCDLCCKRDCRLIYACHIDGCNINLDIECFFLKPTIKWRSHDHMLSLVDKASCDDIRCDACFKSYKEWDGIVPEVNLTQSFLICCMECHSNFHFVCGPLPSSIKYEHHVHSLILVDHSVTEDDSNEYYCDVCEKRRDPRFRVYYCENCKYAAHIHCMINEVMKVLKGDTKKEVEFRALGENRWANIEIEDEEETDKTLWDIINSLSEDEKKMLREPFSFDRPSQQAYRQNTYNYYRKLNSHFQREEEVISIEDIERVEKIFSFGSDDIENFLQEIWYYTPSEELSKLDEKYLRLKVENVEGHTVPKMLAPILRTILLNKNHGDLYAGESSNLSSEMKSVCATLLCIVIDKMCRSKVEDIRESDLKYWYFCLESIRKLARFEIPQLDSFKEFMIPIFLGFEAIRREKETHKKLDRRIRTLEAELKICKENREKLIECTSESKRSKTMKDCMQKALEWQRKNLGDKWF